MRKERKELNLSDLLPNDGQAGWLPSNPREWTKEDVSKTAKSIKEDPDFLEERPILVIPHDDKFIVFAGNLRREGCAKNRMKTAPCVIHYPETEEDQETIIRRAMKDNGSFGKFDWDKVANEWDAYPLADWGVPSWETEIEEEKPVAQAQEDDFNEEDAVETRCSLGDIWQLGEHRLMCGDSTDAASVALLMNGEKADMVFTDPPYGMHLDTDYTKMEGRGRKGKKYDKVIGDNEDFRPELINTIFENFKDCEEIFLWGVDYYIELVPNFKEGSLIVWDKTLQTNGDAGYNSEFELLWSRTPHKKEVLHFNWFRYFGLSSQDIKTREHPTQKPLQVISPFIQRHTAEGANIVDLYGGSGSTLIAAEQLNRKCFMMELDPHYCDVILARWEKLTGQQAHKI